MNYVFGYTSFIDGSARGLPPPGNVFYQMKSRDTFAPIGPFIVTADEIRDPHKLQIRLWVNGVLKQNFNTSDMAHKIPRCIEWVTSIHALEPGDVLATGTNHRGLSAFQDGDRIELEVESVGRLRVKVRDKLKRTWGATRASSTSRRGCRGARRSSPASTPRRRPRFSIWRHAHSWQARTDPSSSPSRSTTGTPKSRRHFEHGEARNPELLKRLGDLGALRIKEMDEAGIDVQVLSHAAPSTQRLDAATAMPLAKRANDRLHETVRAHPDRFAGFAALPTADPRRPPTSSSARSTSSASRARWCTAPRNGVFFDDKRFWPIFERAQALDVPLYLHPSLPHEGGGRRLLQGLPRPTTRGCRPPPGASRSRPRRRASAWCSRACSRSTRA